MSMLLSLSQIELDSQMFFSLSCRKGIIFQFSKQSKRLNENTFSHLPLQNGNSFFRRYINQLLNIDLYNKITRMTGLIDEKIIWVQNDHRQNILFYLGGGVKEKVLFLSKIFALIINLEVSIWKAYCSQCFQKGGKLRTILWDDTLHDFTGPLNLKNKKNCMNIYPPLKVCSPCVWLV